MIELIDKIKDVRSYIRNRFITKSHAVITSLKKGSWHECEELMLHSNFQILVDYVEVQCAWMHITSDPGRQHLKKYGYPTNSWSPVSWVRKMLWRNREAGIARLRYESEVMDQNFSDQHTKGGDYAREQLELYLWWTDIYPARPDPYDLYEWSDYTKIGVLEKQYADEENENLIRLIKIRNTMWT